MLLSEAFPIAISVIGILSCLLPIAAGIYILCCGEDEVEPMIPAQEVPWEAGDVEVGVPQREGQSEVVQLLTRHPSSEKHALAAGVELNHRPVTRRQNVDPILTRRPSVEPALLTRRQSAEPPPALGIAAISGGDEPAELPSSWPPTLVTRHLADGDLPSPSGSDTWTVPSPGNHCGYPRTPGRHSFFETYSPRTGVKREGSD